MLSCLPVKNQMLKGISNFECQQQVKELEWHVPTRLLANASIVKMSKSFNQREAFRIPSDDVISTDFINTEKITEFQGKGSL
mmetsp:Transcript_18827/g.28627  ORF Transcript_18827/g.28627 Transcript_18827/m.28627 type:complete len:82 (+) Transcript_18827:4316-4561(+)